METIPGSVLVTTSHNFEGYKIVAYLGLVAVDTVYNWKEQEADTWKRLGGDLLEASSILGGNAVIGVVTGTRGTASIKIIGTAVKVIPV